MAERVEVVAYDPAWARAFEAIRGRVWSAVSGVAVGIEHVGSTSVPGLAAKPVTDVDVVVAGRDGVTACIGRLEGIGYRHRGDLGIEGREAFWAPAGAPAQHLYVCIEGGLALRNHLALRDFLRAHPDEARAYGELKLQLAARYPGDVDAYCRAKTAFIVGLLGRCGLSAEDVGAIRRDNE